MRTTWAFDVTPEEHETLENLMRKYNFKTHSDFLRECINAYAGEEVLPLYRPHKVIRNIFDSWKFEGGEVAIESDQIKASFNEVPDVETRLNLRFLHFVPKEDKKVWSRIAEKYAIPKVRALLKPI